eukprot:SM000029S10509  [mRNA]  locus=s29:538651:544156:- [translate_table: standard]
MQQQPSAMPPPPPPAPTARLHFPPPPSPRVSLTGKAVCKSCERQMGVEKRVAAQDEPANMSPNSRLRLAVKGATAAAARRADREEAMAKLDKEGGGEERPLSYSQTGERQMAIADAALEGRFLKHEEMGQEEAAKEHRWLQPVNEACLPPPPPPSQPLALHCAGPGEQAQGLLLQHRDNDQAKPTLSLRRQQDRWAVTPSARDAASVVKRLAGPAGFLPPGSTRSGQNSEAAVEAARRGRHAHADASASSADEGHGCARTAGIPPTILREAKLAQLEKEGGRAAVLGYRDRGLAATVKRARQQTGSGAQEVASRAGGGTAESSGCRQAPAPGPEDEAVTVTMMSAHDLLLHSSGSPASQAGNDCRAPSLELASWPLDAVDATSGAASCLPAGAAAVPVSQSEPKLASEPSSSPIVSEGAAVSTPLSLGLQSTAVPPQAWPLVQPNDRSGSSSAHSVAAAPGSPPRSHSPVAPMSLGLNKQSAASAHALPPGRPSAPAVVVPDEGAKVRTPLDAVHTARTWPTKVDCLPTAVAGGASMQSTPPCSLQEPVRGSAGHAGAIADGVPARFSSLPGFFDSLAAGVPEGEATSDHKTSPTRPTATTQLPVDTHARHAAAAAPPLAAPLPAALPPLPPPAPQRLQTAVAAKLGSAHPGMRPFPSSKSAAAAAVGSSSRPPFASPARGPTAAAAPLPLPPSSQKRAVTISGGAGCPSPPSAMNDEELALLLHQELNSSPRMPRASRASASLARHAAVAAAGAGSKRACPPSAASHAESQQVMRKRLKEEQGAASHSPPHDPTTPSARSDLPYTPGAARSGWQDASGSPAVGGLAVPPFRDVKLEMESPMQPGSATSLLELVELLMVAAGGATMSFEDLYRACSPHWHRLRRQGDGGEPSVPSGQRAALVECLRGRPAWRAILDTRPKSSLPLDAKGGPASEGPTTVAAVAIAARAAAAMSFSGGESEDLGGGHVEQAADSDGEEGGAPPGDDSVPKGKRKARRRRWLATAAAGGSSQGDERLLAAMAPVEGLAAVVAEAGKPAAEGSREGGRDDRDSGREARGGEHSGPQQAWRRKEERQRQQQEERPAAKPQAVQLHAGCGPDVEESGGGGADSSLGNTLPASSDEEAVSNYSEDDEEMATGRRGGGAARQRGSDADEETREEGKDGGGGGAG